MKIVFIVPILPPHINGIGEYTLHLAHGLRKLNQDAHIVTSVGQQASESWIHPIIERWESPEIVKGVEPLKPDWISFQYVPQLYHPKGLSWAVGGIPAELKKKLSCKTTVTFHEFSCSWSFNPKKFLLALLLRIQTLRLLNNLDYAVTTCPVYKKILESYLHRPRTCVIPVGANVLPVPLNDDDLEGLKLRTNFIDGTIFAVFGRLSDFRNYSSAIRLLVLAREQGKKAFLLLIGCMRDSNPNLFNALLTEATQKGVIHSIFETGSLSAADISAYLSLADVFLFPQRDGVSTRNTTVISALAHGLPIISYIPSEGNFDSPSRIPHIELAPQGDEATFIQKALHFTHHKTDEHIRKNQMSYYKSYFSWESIANRYLAFMKET